MKKERRHIETAEAQSAALAVLQRGGVVVLPTDTLYGLSTPISSEKGYRRISALKGSVGKPAFLYLASGIEMVEAYVDAWGCTDRAFLEKIWPAPLTAILPAGGRCPPWMGATIALRIPECVPLRAVIDALGEPILSTSVNRSGEPPLFYIDEIERRFGRGVDLIVAGEEMLRSLPSTIVDFSKDAAVLVRRGSYHWASGGGNPSK